MAAERPIYVTEQDLERLRRLILHQSGAGSNSEYLVRLRGELDKAVVVESETVPADVVTMNSTVELTDLDTGHTEVHTLVFPEDADIEQAKVSILAPIGTAMLGYRVGDSFEWKVPAGIRRLRVTKVLYQPEAAGDWGL